LLPQVTNDWKLADQDESAAASQQRWHAALRRFWTNEEGQENSTAANSSDTAQQKPRLAALQWLRALNNSLASVGSPLWAFKPGPWKVQPLLVLSTDAGPVNMAAYSFMQNKLRLRCLLLWDISHRHWNDAKAILSEAGLWTMVLETTFTWNLYHGPWSSASWFHQAHEASIEFARVAQADDPVLLYCAEGILTDRGLTPGLDQGTSLKQLLAVEDFRRKGNKISLTRWFGWWDTAADRLSRWHSELAVTIFMALQEPGGKSVKSLLWALDAAAAEPNPSALAQHPAAQALPAASREQQAVAALPSASTSNLKKAAVAAAPSAAEVSAAPDAFLKASAQAGHQAAAATSSQADETHEPTARDSVRELRAKCRGLGVLIQLHMCS